jgi:hypothetical protein
MLLPFRPVPLLLLAALIGAGGVAAAAPQHRREAPPQATGQDAGAQSRRPPARPDWARPQPRSEDALSDSVRRVEQRTRGQVLSAERVPYDGRNLNRIKVVDERGRVRVYMDDPQAPQHQASRQASESEDSGTPTRDNDD